MATSTKKLHLRKHWPRFYTKVDQENPADSAQIPFEGIRCNKGASIDGGATVNAGEERCKCSWLANASGFHFALNRNHVVCFILASAGMPCMCVVDKIKMYQCYHACICVHLSRLFCDTGQRIQLLWLLASVGHYKAGSCDQDNLQRDFVELKFSSS